MRGMAALVGLLVGLATCVCAIQASAGEPEPPASEDSGAGRLSVHVAAGATLPLGNDAGGDVQSVGIGFAPTPKLTVLVSGWRTHRPTHVRHFSDGATSVTRGGMLQFVSGEVRFALRSGEGLTPYAMTGAGFGVSRPNVNETFPNPVRNPAYTWFGGGGLAVPLGSHVSLSGDVGFLLFGERDTIHLLLPLRAGLAWRF